MKRLVDDISTSEGFAIQVDGSVNKYQIDNKFITIRYLDKYRAMQTGFLCESHSDIFGAQKDCCKLFWIDSKHVIF